MKKIIFIVFLFISCYLIHTFTKTDKVYYLSIGDSLSKGVNSYNKVGYGYSDYIKDYLEKENKLKGYNKSVTAADYRIIDLINLINQNTLITTDDGEITINQLLNKTDILTISIGMNEIYYKLDKNSDNMYDYIDELIKDMEKLFKVLNNYEYKHLFVLNYYNVTNNNDDVFNYANWKLKQLVKNYNYEYIDISKIYYKNPYFFDNILNFNPNINGYKEISKKIIEKI